MALNEVVKNVYTFANILSQAHHSHVRQWDLQSFNNALKWAKFCMKVEEETRDKLYRDELNKHIKSLTILLNPVSILQIDMLMLKDSVDYLCKALCHNQDTPSQIRVALKKLGNDCFEKSWLNDFGKSSHTSYRVYKLLGEDISFEDKNIHLQAKHIVERLMNLQETCTYSKQRYDRFLEKIFNELQKIDTGWELIVHLLLTFTDCDVFTDASEELLQKLVLLLHSSAEDFDCGLWKCDRQLLCTLCCCEDDILDMYLNHIWTWADSMEPEYGLDENGNLYRWRHSTDIAHFMYSNLVDSLHRLIISNPKRVHKLTADLKYRSESSFFNIYKDILNSLWDVESANEDYTVML